MRGALAKSLQYGVCPGLGLPRFVRVPDQRTGARGLNQTPSTHVPDQTSVWARTGPPCLVNRPGPASWRTADLTKHPARSFLPKPGPPRFAQRSRSHKRNRGPRKSLGPGVGPENGATTFDRQSRASRQPPRTPVKCLARQNSPTPTWVQRTGPRSGPAVPDQRAGNRRPRPTAWHTGLPHVLAQRAGHHSGPAVPDQRAGNRGPRPTA